jgi:hypothetical protein
MLLEDAVCDTTGMKNLLVSFDFLYQFTQHLNNFMNYSCRYSLLSPAL